MTAPWAIARSVLTTALLAPLAALVAAVVFVGDARHEHRRFHVARRVDHAAGAAVAFYGIGPAWPVPGGK